MKNHRNHFGLNPLMGSQPWKVIAFAFTMILSFSAGLTEHGQAQDSIEPGPLLRRIENAQLSTTQLSNREQADLVGPRALSRAFRTASQNAAPAVVTILSYGQTSETGEIGGNPQRRRGRGGQGRRGRGGRGNGRRGGRGNAPDSTNPPSSDESDDSTTESDSSEDNDSSEDEEEEGVSPLENNERVPEEDENPGSSTGLGSGLIIDPTGLILTNNHVINGATKVVVQMANKLEYTAVKVAGDPFSDVAIVRIEGEKPFPVVEVGDSDSVLIGDWVLAIGSPFNLDATVSAGIISAKGRKISRIRRGSLIQTDVAINPGNSGGPLIDLDGKVIAINTAIATVNGGYQGIGFAVPINRAVWVARELDQYGKVRRAGMGIVMAPTNANVVKQVNDRGVLSYQLPVGLGVLAYEVVVNSAADKAGIQELDVILAIGGKRTLEPNEVREIVEQSPIGSTQSILVYRDGKELELEIKLVPLDDLTADSSEDE